MIPLPVFFSISQDPPGNRYAIADLWIKYRFKAFVLQDMVTEFPDLVRHLDRGTVHGQ